MSDPLERYQNLGIQEALTRTHHYPLACKELSLILRRAYNELPKNLQSIVFQDTMFAFKQLPRMEMQNAVSAAHILVQSAEAILPKQKKNSATKEYKHAKVAWKRRGKPRQIEECNAELPQDVLELIFSFLDMQSLVSVSLVCRSWNVAASNDHLWETLYATIFSSDPKYLKAKQRQNGGLGKDEESSTSIDWREAFKGAYTDRSSKRLTSSRGYCRNCDMIVWVNNMKCCYGDCGLKSKKLRVTPVSSEEVVAYLLYGSSEVTASESDSEPDEHSEDWDILMRWATY